jgi:hypothetical protein
LFPTWEQQFFKRSPLTQNQQPAIANSSPHNNAIALNQKSTNCNRKFISKKAIALNQKSTNCDCKFISKKAIAPNQISTTSD